MHHVKYFKDLFKSIRDYRNVLLLSFLNENDVDVLHECVLLKNGFNRLRIDFKNILSEQTEECFACRNNEEESSIEKKFLN